MYFWCICGEEGDLRVLLFHLEAPPQMFLDMEIQMLSVTWKLKFSNVINYVLKGPWNKTVRSWSRNPTMVSLQDDLCSMRIFHLDLSRRKMFCLRDRKEDLDKWKSYIQFFFYMKLSSNFIVYSVVWKLSFSSYAYVDLITSTKTW